MADYLSNVDFTEAIGKYRKECLEREAQGLPRNKIPDYIVISITTLANKIACRPNFSGYTYIDEMVSEAIVTCCEKVTNFNPEVSKNAFGYFTQICWYAFLNVIDTEKKEAYIKAKSYYNTVETHGSLLDDPELKEYLNDLEIENDFVPYFDVQEYERKDEEKRRKIKQRLQSKTLEKMMESDSEE